MRLVKVVVANPGKGPKMEFTNAPRRSFAAAMTLVGTPAQVFPLLCPVREYDWIETWSCVMVYSESGVAEPGCIFMTSDQHGQGDEIWTVSRYEPNRAIGFVRVLPGRWVTKHEITLAPMEGARTLAQWSIIRTALGEVDTTIMDRSWEQAAAVPARIELMLNHYLTTGEMLRAGD